MRSDRANVTQSTNARVLSTGITVCLAEIGAATHRLDSGMADGPWTALPGARCTAPHDIAVYHRWEGLSSRRIQIAAVSKPCRS
jgi:hypothetical protein